MNLKEEVLQYKDDMIHNLSKLVSYQTTLDKPEKNAPYGRENARCLEEALNIAKKYGFKIKNLDGHCGYAEIGEGKEIIGILTHLDVVPAGIGWNTDPFTATIKDNKIYGRGTSDDKGATVASLVALKLLKDSNIPLNKRIRLIMGCKEETGSECIKYYIEKEGNIDIGFTPDGSFPVVHGEKGHIRAVFKCENTSQFYIKGGVVDNAVSDSCIVKIEIKLYHKKLMEKYFNKENITYTIENDGDKDIIKVKGISAHASKPELGKNAISYTIMGLKEAGYNDNLIEFYSKYIGLETSGNSMGIKCEDQYGKLTFVNGMIWTENNEIIGTIDIRVPVTLNSDIIVKKLISNQYEGGNIDIIKYSDTTFYPINSKLVKTFMKVYQDVTGDKESQPITTGGGTYAKTMKNCLAFGCKFPKSNNQIHNANEFVEINELILQVELYVKAILELL